MLYESTKGYAEGEETVRGLLVKARFLIYVLRKFHPRSFWSSILRAGMRPVVLDHKVCERCWCRTSQPNRIGVRVTSTVMATIKMPGNNAMIKNTRQQI